MTKLEANKKTGLTKASAADSFQIRSVSQERFVKKIGTVPDETMNKVRIGLSKVFSLNDY
jgi:mRNA interferase MazF